MHFVSGIVLLGVNNLIRLEFMELGMVTLADLLKNRISDLRIKESQALDEEKRKDLMKIRKSNEKMLLELMRGKWNSKNQ